MTKIPAIQKEIVGHLRGAGRPETSRALAQRFLRISQGDEETCRRLLAPFLSTVPGLVHRDGEGWSLERGAPAEPRPESPGDAQDAPAREESTRSLRDFVALASDGTGPGGSGLPAVVSLLPVVAGEECQEEQFPPLDLVEEEGAAPAGAGLTPDVLADLIETIGELPIVCHRAAREVEP